MNGPVPTMLLPVPPWPCAYGLFDGSGLSASPAFRAVVVVDDRVGVEVVAVMKLHALLERGRVGQPIGARGRQVRCQDRDEVAVRSGLEADEALDDLRLNLRRVAIAHERRVGEDHVP